MLLIHVSSHAPGQGGKVYEHARGPFEIGRDAGAGLTPRCVLTHDPFVSRDHVRLEEATAGYVQVKNLSAGQPVGVGSATLPPGGERVVLAPVRLLVGMTPVAVEAVRRDGAEPAYATLAGDLPAAGSLRLADLAKAPDPATLGAWFEAIIAVTRAAAGSDEFFQHTAQALVDLVGLDVGLVLLRDRDGWSVVARAASGSAEATPNKEFSLTILGHLVEERQTLYRVGSMGFRAVSLADVDTVVAAPVLLGGEVVGAVYGTRWHWTTASLAVGPLEAQMVHVLATAVGVGLARAGQEAEAARLRVQFQQYFSEQLARELERDSGRLDGQDREVTLLFADIRGFSKLAERLGPRDTLRMVSEVMEALTEAVHAYQGVVTDYVGDEIVALWNAPTDQPDHARLATACAADIPGYLERVNARLKGLLPDPVAVGVGINTGVARVGNTGTRYKFKYGALGHPVNLASRIQGATKAFKLPVLVAGSTWERLAEPPPGRRLGPVRVVGINQPVELYELATGPTPEWEVLRIAYEAALRRFEAGEAEAADEVLRALLDTPAGRADGATRLLAGRVTACLAQGLTPPAVPAVIELLEK